MEGREELSWLLTWAIFPSTAFSSGTTLWYTEMISQARGLIKVSFIEQKIWFILSRNVVKLNLKKKKKKEEEVKKNTIEKTSSFIKTSLRITAGEVTLHIDEFNTRYA